MFEAEWKNRKGKRAGQAPVQPLYNVEDAIGILSCFVQCEYEKEIIVAEGIRIRFVDAGHLLGSSSIEVWISENGIQKKLVFSGDIGNVNQPLIRDPQYIKEADYVVMESTYGDRNHEKPAVDYATELAQVIQRTLDRGGNLVIPSFAVGRTQEMLYFIRMIKEQHLVKNHDGFEVWVDSPLANEATTIFQERMYSDFDEEARALLEQGINPIGFAGLKISITSADSIAINNDTKPKVILSASGMCDAGRIKHHLKHNLWRPESTVLFVGYQAVGTLGRAILDGAPSVKLFGEHIDVKAEICRLPGISGHADQQGLLRWISAFEQKPQKVFVFHGDETFCDVFTNHLKEELGFDAYAPFSGTEFDRAAGRITYEAKPIRIKKETGAEITATARVTKTFARLLAAGQRLIGVIRKNEGGANKDIDRFTREINDLCDKWER
jgi:metallo-beta-lactamase family protein